MIEREVTTGSKAAILLALGAILGLAGFVLFAGGSFARHAIPEGAPPTILRLLSWGPWTLIGVGGCLATLAGVVLSIDWFQRRT